MQFKLDFAAAHREFRLTNQTAQQSVFHSSNAMIKQGRGDTMQVTVNAIAQLATATASASDLGMVATLTATNAKLASQLESAQASSTSVHRYFITEGKDQACMERPTTYQVD
jgi:hypothetical protein